MIFTLACAALTGALIEHGTAWPELYLLTICSLIVSYTAAHIVVTQFAHRTITMLTFLLLLSCKLLLNPTATCGAIALQAGSTLTILLPCIT